MKVINGKVEEAEIPVSAREAQALMQIIDIAVKSGGLAIAEAAVVLAKKFSEPFKDNAQAVKGKPEKDETPER